LEAIYGVSNKSLAPIFSLTNLSNQVSQIFRAMIKFSCIIFNSFASFYPMVENTTLLIVKKTCPNCNYFISEILFVQNRSPSELFFDAAEQAKVRDRETGGGRWMRDPPASHSSHFINDHAYSVARRIIKMRASPAKRLSALVVEWNLCNGVIT
jgi:hypothetical protein